MFGIDLDIGLVWIQLLSCMLRQVCSSRSATRINLIEGNGAQLNCSSGDYGAGCIGRFGPLAQLMTRKTSMIVKMDPITEELARTPNGLCIKVSPSKPALKI